MSTYYVEIIYRHPVTNKLALGIHETPAEDHRTAYAQVKAEHYADIVVDNAHISSRYSDGRYLCNAWANLPNWGR